MSVDSKDLLLLFCLLQLIHCVISVKYQASNLNSGRVKLVLYQGNIRHELSDTSCPLGLQLVTPQLFSCACVTGVWAFYDAACRAPFETIAGINHCFKLPLDVYVHQIISIANPTTAQADVLTFFKGKNAQVGSKFIRATHAHSNLHVPLHMLSVGPKWMLSTSSNGERVCLDSTKHPFYNQLTQNAHAYCLYNNVSDYIQDVDFVTIGCASFTKKIEHIAPQACFPYFDGNSEEICKDPAHVEAYERAIGSSSLHSTTFKRLADGVRDTAVKLRQFNVKSNRPNVTKSTPIMPKKLNSKVNVTTNPPSSNSEALGAPIMDEEPAQTDPGKNYLEIVNNEEEFLRPSRIESDPKVFELLMEHQHMRIAHALGLSSSKPKLKSKTMDRILAQIVKIFSHQCPSVPEDYLNLAVDTFSRLLHRFGYQHKLVGNGKAVLHLLKICENKGAAYEFLRNGETCGKNFPLKLNASGTIRPIRVPLAYKSDEFEPVLESVWKLTVHTLIYCNVELNSWVDPATELAIAFSEMFSSEVNSIWNRKRTVPEEYGGVLGDVRKLVKHIDACVFAATVVTNLKVTYSRPPYKSTSPPNDQETGEDYQFIESPPVTSESPADRTFPSHKILQKRQESTDVEEFPSTTSEISQLELAEDSKNSEEKLPSSTTTEPSATIQSEEDSNSNESLKQPEDSQSVEESTVTSTRWSRRKRNSYAEGSWRKQRLILGFAYCLKKVDELEVHFGQNCEI